MCQILLSINPKHVNNIFNGTKKFEFRKIMCNKEVNSIIFYATSPVMKIVGEAAVDEVLVDAPSVIWDKTNQYSGITKEFFDKYYVNKRLAVAYKLKDIKEYKITKKLSELGVKRAPQSFQYLTE